MKLCEVYIPVIFCRGFTWRGRGCPTFSGLSKRWDFQNHDLWFWYRAGNRFSCWAPEICFHAFPYIQHPTSNIQYSPPIDHRLVLTTNNQYPTTPNVFLCETLSPLFLCLSRRSRGWWVLPTIPYRENGQKYFLTQATSCANMYLIVCSIETPADQAFTIKGKRSNWSAT